MSILPDRPADLSDPKVRPRPAETSGFLVVDRVTASFFLCSAGLWLMTVIYNDTPSYCHSVVVSVTAGILQCTAFWSGGETSVTKLQLWHPAGRQKNSTNLDERYTTLGLHSELLIAQVVWNYISSHKLVEKMQMSIIAKEKKKKVSVKKVG